MNKLVKMATVSLLTVTLMFSAQTAGAYPSATGSVGKSTAQVVTSPSGSKTLAISGAAEFGGVTLAKKTLAVSLKLPSGAKVAIGTVRTDSRGNYKLSIKNKLTKPGVYRLYVTYKGKSTAVSFTVR
jgi:methionine-rich copper-binding protein CopC